MTGVRIHTSTRLAVTDPATCDARTSFTPRKSGWGWEPVECGQRIGLISFRDAAGRTRHHCSREGHRASAEPEYPESELRALAGDR